MAEGFEKRGVVEKGRTPEEAKGRAGGEKAANGRGPFDHVTARVADKGAEALKKKGD